MRLIVLFVPLLLLLSFCPTCSAIMFTENDIIPINNVNYSFSNNISFGSVTVTNISIIFDGVVFSVISSIPINITIDRIISSKNFNFTMYSEYNGTVNFNISGNSFVKEYVGGYEIVSLYEPVENTPKDTSDDVLDFPWFVFIGPFMALLLWALFNRH